MAEEETAKNYNNTKIPVLYIDDEPNNLTSFKASFRREFKVFTAESAKEAWDIIKNNEIAVIITDQRMPDVTGVEFLESLIPEHPDPIRILLTGYSDIEAVIDAINKGQVYRYINKPWDEQELKMIIQNAYEYYRLKMENKELMKSLMQANKQLEFMLRQRLIS